MQPCEDDSEQADNNHERNAQQDDRHSYDQIPYHDGQQDCNDEIRNLCPEVVRVILIVQLEYEIADTGEHDKKQNKFHHGISRFPTSNRRIATMDISTHMKNRSENTLSFAALK